MAEPLNIFLYQEIQRLQFVIGRVRSMLKQMVQAIELFTHRQAIYTTANKGTNFTIDTAEVQAILNHVGVSFAGNYLLRLLNKYHHPAP
jgi:hypothetical protein